MHVVNVDIQDNHEEATLGAFLICELCQCVSLSPGSRHPYRGGDLSSLATYFHILVNTKFQIKTKKCTFQEVNSDVGLRAHPSVSVVGGSD